MNTQTLEDHANALIDWVVEQEDEFSVFYNRQHILDVLNAVRSAAEEENA